ncbi:MAG: flavodoxin domain-containing protein, partial [Rhodoplanes sp.]
MTYSRETMQLYFASRDGQARKIATRIAERLASHDVAATPADLTAAQPSPAELAQAAFVVAVLAVRYGRHLPEAMSFVETFALLHRPPPLALASVNLTARKPGKDTAEGSAYLRKLIARNGL